VGAECGGKIMKVKRSKWAKCIRNLSVLVIVVFVFVMTVVSALAFTIIVQGTDATAPVSITDPCILGDRDSANMEMSYGLKVIEACETGSFVEWDEFNETMLGNITDGEVIVAPTFIYVDPVARPDLDKQATLNFKRVPFAVQPNVFKDGTTCLTPVCNSTYNSLANELTVVVSGFSNYSLEGQEDFTVYMDDNPELKEKVYQTVDLGDARRSGTYTCIVQVFGRNEDEEWVLVQTNPERAVQGKLFGDTDPNQPESLGYFPTVSGMANTYFRNDNLHGYQNFNLVVQCASNSSSVLVYETPIRTTYSPAGRELVSRGLWITDGSNAFYLSVWVIGGIIFIWIGLMIWRTFRR